MATDNYKHVIKEVVKFHEVDLLGVCNNAVYFNYFEDARLDYTIDLKKKYDLKELLEGDSFFIMVHNDCDYIEPALLHDELNVYTRVNFIGTTSFGFQHIVEKAATKKIIARGGGVVVHINKSTKQPVPLPEEFHRAVKDFDPEVEFVAK